MIATQQQLNTLPQDISSSRCQNLSNSPFVHSSSSASSDSMQAEASFMEVEKVYTNTINFKQPLDRDLPIHLDPEKVSLHQSRLQLLDSNELSIQLTENDRCDKLGHSFSETDDCLFGETWSQATPRQCQPMSVALLTSPKRAVLAVSSWLLHRFASDMLSNGCRCRPLDAESSCHSQAILLSIKGQSKKACRSTQSVCTGLAGMLHLHLPWSRFQLCRNSRRIWLI